MMAKRANYSRRKSVSAEGYDPEADDSDDDADDRVMNPKSDEQRARLIKVVENMLLFKSLDSDQMSQVLDAMLEKIVAAGDHKHVGQYDNKGSFGELALMYNAPRAATIIANTEGQLWAMDRQTFRKIVVKATAKKRRKYEEFLKKVEILSVLKDDEITKVADAIETKEYKDGESIITQGDKPDYFYIVVEGQCDVSKVGANPANPEEEIHLVSLTSSQFFGELAFLTNKPRAAHVKAKGQVKCGCLDIQAFERLLGPCKKLLERNMEIYEKQLATIAEGLSVE